MNDLLLTTEIIEFLLIITLLPLFVLYFRKLKITDTYLNDMITIGVPIALLFIIRKIVVRIYNKYNVDEEDKEDKDDI